jgi:hypothetical protein
VAIPYVASAVRGPLVSAPVCLETSDHLLGGGGRECRAGRAASVSERRKCQAVRAPRHPLVPRLELIENRESPTSLLGANPLTSHIALAATGLTASSVPTAQTTPRPVLDHWLAPGRDANPSPAARALIAGHDTSATSRDSPEAVSSELTNRAAWNSPTTLFAANFEALLSPDSLFADPFGSAPSHGGAGTHSNVWQPGFPSPLVGEGQGGGSGSAGGSSFSGVGGESHSGGAGDNGGINFPTSAPPGASGSAGSGAPVANGPGSPGTIPSNLLFPVSQPASPPVNPQSSPQTNPQGQGSPLARPDGQGPLLRTGPKPIDTPPDFNSCG